MRRLALRRLSPVDSDEMCGYNFGVSVPRRCWLGFFCVEQEFVASITDLPRAQNHAMLALICLQKQLAANQGHATVGLTVGRPVVFV